MKHRLDDDDHTPAGWAQRREVKDEPPARTLTNPGAVYGWTAKAGARSGPRFAPGLGQSKSS